MSFASSVDLQIRECDDATLIHRLTLDAWAGTVDPRSSGHRLTVDEVAATLADNTTALVAYDGTGTPVGSVMLSLDEPAVELMKLAVPAARRSGVASTLIEESVRWARSNGAREIVLAVSLFQPQLARYYARRGFRQDPQRVYTHASPHSPAPIVMVRTLTGPAAPDPVGDAAAALQQGNLAVLPTETVYGLAALATDPVALRRVFATKGRPVDHPLIVHVADRHAMNAWAIDVPDAAWRLAETCWPGPLTMVLRKHPSVVDEITGGLPTVAVRVPSHPVALGVLAMLGENAGVAAPSANRFGRVSPTTAQSAIDELGDSLVDGDLVLDGGPCRIGIESTIIDLSDTVPTILRPGGLDVERIESILGTRVERVASGPSRAPGMLAAHYAPRAGVRLCSADDVASVVDGLVARGQRVGLLAPHGLKVSALDVEHLAAAEPYDGEHLAPILYARLREADSRELDALVVVTPPNEGLGWAVNDRLSRAATGSTTRH